jgi:hypothetical protein
LTMHLFTAFSFFAMGWTALIFYSNVFWSASKPGCIFFGTFFITNIVLGHSTFLAMKWLNPGVPLTKLTTRIYHRASSLALGSFLERSKEDLRNPPPLSMDAKSQPELFVQLHGRYMETWSTHNLNKTDLYAVFAATLMPGSYLLATIINAAVGGCLTFWTILGILNRVVYSTFGLLFLPVVNRQITTVVELYTTTQRSLNTILAEASRLPPTPERQHVIAQLQAHSTLLGTFEKADRLRAKFLGFPVTWGFVKTYFLTLFTLGVGLWSVLKGSGVGFTLQSVCPG